MKEKNKTRESKRNYKKKIFQMSISFKKDDPDLLLLERLAAEYGNRKVAIVEGLRLLGTKKRIVKYVDK